MPIELNRRTFLALIGASTAAVAIGHPARISAHKNALNSGTPRYFMSEQDAPLPAGPKTAAITYLCE